MPFEPPPPNLSLIVVLKTRDTVQMLTEIRLQRAEYNKHIDSVTRQMREAEEEPTMLLVAPPGLR